MTDPDPGPARLPVPAFALGRVPRITFGAGAAAGVPAIVAAVGRRVLLVTGGASLAASGRRQALVEGLAAAGVALAGEVAVSGEPSPGVVDGAVAAHRESGVDVVLAVGGGSVLDAGKAIAAMLGPGAGGSVIDHLEGLPGFRPYEGTPVPLVAVPTTAGTGSVATRNAVISLRGPEGWKRSIRHERMVAVDAVVDPDLLAGASQVQIAANGMDAVTQLLEAYTSTKAGPLTDALALDGLAAARDSLLAWHAEPDGPGAPAARSGMAYAALLSGICLAHAGLGGVHGLASPLGAQLPIPHGIACGTTLAGIVEANVRALETRETRGAEATSLEPGARAAGIGQGGTGRAGTPALARYAVLGRLLARLPEAAPDVEARAALVEVLRNWTSALAIPGLGSFGLTRDGIGAIVADARGSSMRTNPVVLTDEELESVLRTAL